MVSRKKIYPIGTTIVLLLVFAIFYYLRTQPTQNTTTVELKPGDYLFCFWNVENFFDDRDDKRGRVDEEYDNWFAQNPADLQLKLKRMTDVLLGQNGGKGPDIIALAEVENQRAGELLKNALNAKLADPDLHYKHVLMKEVRVGRHIAPVIITRLPVVRDKTKQLGRKKQRTLEGHIQPKNAPPLVVIASHWTSRRSGGEEGRAEYAKDIYGRFRSMFESNNDVDVLVCGDFNDTPEDVSVTRHLKATGEANLVRGPEGPRPLLFNLMAGKSPAQFGTLYYSGWFVFDQIVVSPGMLDNKGWSCRPQHVATIKTLSPPSGNSITLQTGGKALRPWRFGNRSDDPKRRGYSDHFPVSVVLTLHGNNTLARK